MTLKRFMVHIPYLDVQTDWSVTSRSLGTENKHAYALLFVTVGRKVSGKSAHRRKQSASTHKSKSGRPDRRGKPDRRLRKRSQQDGRRQAEYGWLLIQADIADFSPKQKTSAARGRNRQVEQGWTEGQKKTRLHCLRRNGCVETCRCDCTKQNRTSTESFRQTGPLRLEA